MSKVEFVAEFHCIVITFFSVTLVSLTLESSRLRGVTNETH